VWAQTRALIPGLLLGLLWAVSLAAISLFLASLTGRRGFATGTVAIAFLLTYTLAQILLQVESQGVVHGGPVAGSVINGPPPSLAEKVSGLFSPFTLFDGVRRWLGAFGAVYALVLIILVGLCLYGLAARYRKARLS
jgi:ABC-2 type transport system permease protein